MSRIYLLVVIIIHSSSISYCQNASVILHDMLTTIKATKTIQLNIESKERIYGKMHNEETSLKINTSPLKVYVMQIYSKKKVEGLYVTGENEGKVIINPGTFPWVSLNLDPDGELMLDNRHHPIYHAGFGYTASILEDLLNKYPTDAIKMIKYNGIEKIKGQACYHLTLLNPSFKLTLYNTQTDETPISIAKKLKISFYSILENNPRNKINTKFKLGTRIIVPSDYASRMELYIHTTLHYPVCVKVFDNKGFFEEFTFTNVILNPTFKSIDFSIKNPAYNF